MRYGILYKASPIFTHWIIYIIICIYTYIFHVNVCMCIMYIYIHIMYTYISPPFHSITMLGYGLWHWLHGLLGNRYLVDDHPQELAPSFWCRISQPSTASWITQLIFLHTFHDIDKLLRFLKRHWLDGFRTMLFNTLRRRRNRPVDRTCFEATETGGTLGKKQGSFRVV